MTTTVELASSEERASLRQAQTLIGRGQANKNLAIRIDRVSKRFCRDLKKSWHYGLLDIASELAYGKRASLNLRPGEFLALDDVSIELERGQSLALIGPNGAGKTTLLKLIAGLLRPDKGQLLVEGRVVPMMSLGVGFRQILSGRENIFANMALRGVRTADIKERIDDVIAFADLGEAIDSPVQSYSSGMFLRLAFACAVHTKPDILLLDELLSVGDFRFQMKCNRKLAELKADGTSFVITSHYANALKDLCDLALHIDEGKVVALGPAAEVIENYQNQYTEKQDDEQARSLPVQPDNAGTGNEGLHIKSVYFRDQTGAIVSDPESLQPVTICIHARTNRSFEGVSVMAWIWRLFQRGSPTMSFSSKTAPQSLQLPAGETEMRIMVHNFHLIPGRYVMRIVLRDRSGPLDGVESFKFEVSGEGRQDAGADPATYSVVSLSSGVFRTVSSARAK